MKKLIIQIIIACIIVVLINCLIYAISPNFQEDDIYEIKGKCLDIYTEKNYASNNSVVRKYLYMDNGQKYRIHNTLIDYIGGNLNVLKNETISFYASDKSIFWYDDHQVVAWSHIKDETLKETNQENFTDRFFLGILTLLVGFLFLIPQILHLSAKHDAKKEALWVVNKNKILKQKVANKRLSPISEQKTMPKNISKKK